MNRTRWVWACAFFVLAVLFAAYPIIASINPHVWPIRAPDPNAPTAVASLSYEEDATRGPIAGQVRRFVSTDIDIRYTKEISEDQYTEVMATIRQFERISGSSSSDRSGVSDSSGRSSLRRLESQVRMSLESPAFEFGSNGNERVLGESATLPVTVSWAPTPKHAGDLALLLRLKSVRGATLEINGKRRDITGNDDISLPVTVRHTGGLTPFWLFWFSIAGSVIGFLVTSGIALYAALKK
jgi:hypothetical protein